jgi:Tfp pilus assembly protein PilF
MKVFVELFVAAALIVAPLSASAQGTSQCDPDQGNPQFVARAWLSMSQAIAKMNNNADPTPDLKAALRALSDPRARDRDKNLVGQQYTTAQAYMLLMAHGTPAIVKRSDIGLQTDPDAMIDLVVAADTLFTAVQRAHPECAELIGQWRQQAAWLNIVNSAINAMNADKLDSAEYLARRALILDQRAPYAYVVLANVARVRNQDSVALAYFRQSLQAAGTDTSYADIRVKTMGDIARLLADRAEAAPAARRRALAREAVTAYESYLAEREIDDLSRGFAISQLATLYVLAGDSARIRNAYAAVVRNPAGFGERTLLEAGMVATRAGVARDAATLFAAVNAANAYQRDALNNLAASYIATGEFSKVFPLVQRLIQLDPNNPDTYMLNAYAYAGLIKDATPAQRRAYNDSLVKYNELAERMAVRVSFTEFSRLRAETRLAGRIENRGRTARTFNLEIELLDRNGAVVGTQQASVGPVAASGHGEFQVVIPTAGESVAGFRYKRLT